MCISNQTLCRGCRFGKYDTYHFLMMGFFGAESAGRLTNVYSNFIQHPNYGRGSWKGKCVPQSFQPSSGISKVFPLASSADQGRFSETRNKTFLLISNKWGSVLLNLDSFYKDYLKVSADLSGSTAWVLFRAVSVQTSLNLNLWPYKTEAVNRSRLQLRENRLVLLLSFFLSF